MEPILPRWEGLNITALQRSTARYTNSYKFVYLLALLDALNETSFKTGIISLIDLAERMLALAWYPHTMFKLSFGKQDMIGRALDSLQVGARSIKKENVLRELRGKATDEELTEYVPYRFIRSFFEQEMKGRKDYLVNNEVAQRADLHFDTVRPLYRFSEDRRSIEMHPLWMDYLRANFGIIEGWAYWQWLQYMQNKNPHAPAVSNKLTPPGGRASMPREHIVYWRNMLLQRPETSCIYSGSMLNSFSLDHFIPWSFIAHNQLWNLIPTTHNVNSQKSNNLPSLTYLEPFVRLQYEGLKCAQGSLAPHMWESKVECFMNDLRLEQEADLLNYDRLGAAYEATLRPLLEIAKRQGFSSGWIYSQSCPGGS